MAQIITIYPAFSTIKVGKTYQATGESEIAFPLPSTVIPESVSVKSGEISIYPTFSGSAASLIGKQVQVDYEESNMVGTLISKDPITVRDDDGLETVFQKYDRLTYQYEPPEITFQLPEGISNVDFEYQVGGLYWKPFAKVYISDNLIELEIGALIYNETDGDFFANEITFIQPTHRYDELHYNVSLQSQDGMEIPQGVSPIIIEKRQKETIPINILNMGPMIVETFYKFKVENQQLPAAKYEIYRRIEDKYILYMKIDKPKTPLNGIFQIKHRNPYVDVYYDLYDHRLKVDNKGGPFKLCFKNVAYEIQENAINIIEDDLRYRLENMTDDEIDIFIERQFEYFPKDVTDRNEKINLIVKELGKK